ncbi:hypothetical protein RI367_000215 [Sorochytrium milnesiophthora]
MKTISGANFPSTYRDIIVVKRTFKFEDATEIQEHSFSELLKTIEQKKKFILVRNHYVGINASDINYSAGRYTGTPEPPHKIGFESIGEVVAIGDDVKKVKLGGAVVTFGAGAFAEYQVLSENVAFPVPVTCKMLGGVWELRPEFLGILVNGLTAYLALHSAARIKKGDTVLVTAAAGGTGQIACQVAKMAGCKVLGTCGSEDKAEMLRSFGVDRPVNYKTEKLGDVLRSECKQGVDVVFESVGGEMLQTIAKNLAVKARMLIIGSVSSYQSEGTLSDVWGDAISTVYLMQRSASCVGFFLNHYASEFPAAWKELVGMVHTGKLKVNLDMQDFKGLESVGRAVDFLNRGKNAGKVAVKIVHSEGAKL